jgi:hypothetical protein
MDHIMYGLMCCENFVGDEVCRIVKKVETTVLHNYHLSYETIYQLRLMINRRNDLSNTAPGTKSYLFSSTRRIYKKENCIPPTIIPP